MDMRGSRSTARAGPSRGDPRATKGPKWTKPNPNEKFFSVPFEMIPEEIPVVYDGLLTDAMIGDYPHYKESLPLGQDAQYHGEGEFLDSGHANPLIVTKLMDITQFAFGVLLDYFRHCEEPAFTRRLQADFNLYHRNLWMKWIDSGGRGNFRARDYLAKLNKFTILHSRYARFHEDLGKANLQLNFGSDLKKWEDYLEQRKIIRNNREHASYKVPRKIHPLADYAWNVAARLLPKAVGTTICNEEAIPAFTSRIQEAFNEICCDYESGIIDFDEYKRDIGDAFCDIGAWAIPYDIVKEFQKFVRLGIKKAFITLNICLVSHLDVQDPTRTYCAFGHKPYINQQVRDVVGRTFQCQLKNDPRIDPEADPEQQPITLPIDFW